MKSFVVFIIGLLLYQMADAQVHSKIDWKEDLDFIAKELPRKHYNFFTNKTEGEFMNGLEAIKTQKDSLTDLGVAIKIQQLISGFGDSHTYLSLDPFLDRNKTLPVKVNVFTEGVFILHTLPEYGSMLGKELISINDVPMATIVDSLGTLITMDNPASIKKALPKLLISIDLLEYFGFTSGNHIVLGVKDKNGKREKQIITPGEVTRQKRVQIIPDIIPLYLLNEKIFFHEAYQKADKIYYIQYNKCWGKELELLYGNKENAEQIPSFEEFGEKVLKTLGDEKIEKIIFDLRLNSGGSSAQGTKLAEKIAEYLEKNPAVKLYVVVGRSTFSSAIINAMDFKKGANAIILGEETAGKPNHFGEVKNFRLPGSGTIFNYSTKYFQRTKEDTPSLMPDVLLESRFEDFLKGIDPVYEWVKKQ
jgi:hypothetical protein